MQHSYIAREFMNKKRKKKWIFTSLGFVVDHYQISILDHSTKPITSSSSFFQNFHLLSLLLLSSKWGIVVDCATMVCLLDVDDFFGHLNHFPPEIYCARSIRKVLLAAMLGSLLFWKFFAFDVFQLGALFIRSWGSPPLRHYSYGIETDVLESFILIISALSCKQSIHIVLLNVLPRRDWWLENEVYMKLNCFSTFLRKLFCLFQHLPPTSSLCSCNQSWADTYCS